MSIFYLVSLLWLFAEKFSFRNNTKGPAHVPKRGFTVKSEINCLHLFTLKIIWTLLVLIIGLFFFFFSISDLFLLHVIDTQGRDSEHSIAILNFLTEGD